jgi:hypothetical protein
METLFAASVALDEDLSDQEEDPTSDSMDVDDIAEVLFLEAMEDVIKMAGDGS